MYVVLLSLYLQLHHLLVFCFFFNDTATTEIYTLSLHDALPICVGIVQSTSSHGRPENDRLGSSGPLRGRPLPTCLGGEETPRREGRSRPLRRATPTKILPPRPRPPPPILGCPRDQSP